MEVFGLAGWSGSGKTTLLKRLIPVLISKGILLTLDDNDTGCQNLLKYSPPGVP